MVPSCRALQMFLFVFGSSNFDKFTKMCQFYLVLLPQLFFLKNRVVMFSHQEPVIKGLLYFKISGRPRPGQDVYFSGNLTFWGTTQQHGNT